VQAAARYVLADLPLKVLLSVALISYECDNVTRLIVDRHEAAAFAPVAHLTVGDLRNWLLGSAATPAVLAALAPGWTPEMVAAVLTLMRNQDLVLLARNCQVITRFRNTQGLPGRMAVHLQPNHPTDDLRGVAASVLDGLMLGAGDVVIGINPVSDSQATQARMCQLFDDLVQRFEIPSQGCVLTHVTNNLKPMEDGVPVDLVFQSLGGSEITNRSFGVAPELLTEVCEAARALELGGVGDNVMYFEAGQGSALLANGHGGVDQQTCEARAYGLARCYEPLLVNTVVGLELIRK
jgi:ethanolamine ammonia-lyase large subunit